MDECFRISKDDYSALGLRDAEVGYRVVARALASHQSINSTLTDPTSLTTRVIGGFPVASSDSGKWHLYLQENALLVPITAAVNGLQPFLIGVLDLVEYKLTHSEPELTLGFTYVERAIKLVFQCAQEDVQSCSWEAVKFFVEWQLNRLDRRLPSFCRGVLQGPGNQLIQVRLGTPNTARLIHAASASDLGPLRETGEMACSLTGLATAGWVDSTPEVLSPDPGKSKHRFENISQRPISTMIATSP
ncbi:MAG: hypothetical protein Q9222_004131 [Ikaeria aurantiellina]